MVLLLRSLLALACAVGTAASAEPGAARRGYLGLQLGHSGTSLTCGRPAFACEWAWTGSALPGAQLNLVGRTRLGESIRLEGRIGTFLSAGDAAIMGAAAAPAAEPGYRLAYGAGLRWNFSRSGWATFGVDAYDQPLAGGGRETVRAATLGLQWRY